MTDETTEVASHRSCFHAAWFVCAVAASLALVAAVHAVPYIPTNDGPQAVLIAFIENHYSDPGVVFPEQVEPTWQFAHRGFSFLFLPLEALFGWKAALRASISLIALTTALGFVALVTSLSRDRRPLGLLGFALAFGWHLYMGFFSYEWAIGIGLFLIALVVAGKSQSLVGRLLLAFGLGFQAVCHVFAAALTGLVLVALVTFRSNRRDRGKELVKLAAMGLPAFAVFLAATLQHRDLTTIPLSSEWMSLPVGERLAQLPHLICPGPAYRAWSLLAAALAAVVVVYARWRHAGKADRALACASTALVAAGVLAPLHMPGWQFISPRFVPIGALLALGLIPFELLAKANHRRVGVAILTCVVFASLWGSTTLHRSLYASCASELAGLRQPVRRTSMQLPILLGRGMDPSLSSQVPHLDPVLHLGALYAVEHGGSIPYLFTGASAVHAFRSKNSERRVRPIPPIDPYWTVLGTEEFEHDPTYRNRIVDELSAFGMFYESIVALRARSEDIERLRLRGYEADWASGSLFLGHFAPCSASVEIVGTGPAAGIAWGLYPLPDASQRMPLPPAAQGNGAPLRVGLEGVACGEIWVRLEGRDAAQRIPCREANRSGLLVENVRRGVRAQFRCTTP
ncbi:MAG TPA: hypothetical protein PLI95_26010 [Polyangiaceae bacterium]|nr:hypothetical protein [Polyangiaceae bacterium]